jgi:hypothetical protein
MRRPTLVLSLLIAAACGSSGGSAGSVSTPTHDRSVIPYEDMQRATGVNNLYEVVQRLRPEWLKSRGVQANQMNRGQIIETAAVVYIDGQRNGEVDMLKSMPIRGLAALRFYSASEAQVKFGTGNMAPVIEVITTLK